MDAAGRTLVHTLLVALPLLAIGSALQAQALPTVRLIAGPTETSADAYYAYEMGFFKRAGLNVELQQARSGAVEAAAVASGSVDIGDSNLLSFADAKAHDLPFVAIAPGWIDRNGGDFASLKMVEVTAAETVAALEQNRIAAGVLSDPQLSSERSRIRILGKCYDAVRPSFMLTVWFSTLDWANKNPDAIRRFNEAMNAAEDWAQRNPEQARTVLEKWYKTSVVHMHHFHSRTVDPRMIQPVLDAGFKYKLITKQLNAADLIWSAPK